MARVYYSCPDASLLNTSNPEVWEQCDFSEAEWVEVVVPEPAEPPTPVLPHLTLAEGTQVAFAIVGCWTAGLVLRLYIRATQNNRYG